MFLQLAQAVDIMMAQAKIIQILKTKVKSCWFFLWNFLNKTENVFFVETIIKETLIKVWENLKTLWKN